MKVRTTLPITPKERAMLDKIEQAQRDGDRAWSYETLQGAMAREQLNRTALLAERERRRQARGCLGTAVLCLILFVGIPALCLIVVL